MKNLPAPWISLLLGITWTAGALLNLQQGRPILGTVLFGAAGLIFWILFFISVSRKHRS